LERADVFTVSLGARGKGEGKKGRKEEKEREDG